MVSRMTEQRTPFTHAISNPSARRDIALAVRDGIDPWQLAAEFSISLAPVHRYANEWEGAQRKVQALTDWEREAIVDGCRRDARRRYVRKFGAEVVAQEMGRELTCSQSAVERAVGTGASVNNIHHCSRPVTTSRDQALRRLRDDAPEQHSRDHSSVLVSPARRGRVGARSPA